MFDTMTLTKLTGALCGALLVFLLGNWVAEEMYHMGGGHGDDHGQAYVIDTGEEDQGGGDKDEGPDFAVLMAEADQGKGAKVFGKCKACHKLEEGASSTGPSLYGVVGREVGAVEGFGYSGALVAVAETWGIDELNGFLENPKGYAPGTKMSFAGLKKPADRANLIAYLDMTDGDLTPYAAPATEAAAEGEDHSAAEEPATEDAGTETAAADAGEAETEAATTQEAEAEAAETEAVETETATTEAAETEAATAETEAATTEAAEAEMAASEQAETEAAATEGAAAESEAVAVMAGDVAKGKKVYKKCKACHKVEEGKNGVGPSLYGIVGRAVGSVDGFKYSGALVAVADTWDAATLDAFLAKPKDFAPGTKMSFAGLKKESDRANVIAYLDSLDD